MDYQRDYQTSRFDAGTFIITAIVLLVFVIMVVCFLRAFIRFLQNHYVSKNHMPERYESNNGINGTPRERKVQPLARGSNTSLYSVRSTRQNVQPVRQYSKYKITTSIDTVDQSSASEALLRSHDGNFLSATDAVIVPAARPPSYQEAMASSRENLTDLCDVLSRK